jgi:hypothetical protein
MTLGRRGEIDRAAEVAVRCIKREKTPHGTLAIPSLVSFLAHIYLMQGRLHAAASLCHEYLDPIREKGIRFIYSAGSMNIALGEALYEWNCLEEAEQQIREGNQANEPWVDIMTDAFGLLALIRVLQAFGQAGPVRGRWRDPIAHRRRGLAAGQPHRQQNHARSDASRAIHESLPDR